MLTRTVRGVPDAAVARRGGPWQTSAPPRPSIRTAPLLLSISAAGLSDPGRRRERNEDALVLEPGAGLVAVADGMGGHPAGHVASALAAAEIQRQLGADPSPPGTRSAGSPSALGARMVEAVREADARVRAGANRGEGREGMGTTLTVLLAPPGGARLAIGHVGDSRAYVLESGGLRQLTRDHTWVQEQVEAGSLTAGQARAHPRAHMLTRSVGLGDPIEPQLVERPLAPGEVYLLCTDGLTTMLTDAAMERILADTLPLGLEPAARALVDAANDRGGPDNITVALARVGDG